jgi:putative DNA primase/helicase
MDMTIKVLNGLLDVETLAFRPFTHRLNITYNEKEPCNRWKAFLRQVIKSPTQIRQLQEFFGYCLTQDTRYKKALSLSGLESENKDMIIKALQWVFGNKHCVPILLDGLNDAFHRANLHETLIALAVDVNETLHPKNFSTFMAIVDGGPMTASNKHQTPFEFTPYCKLILCNKKPIPDTPGITQRIIPIEISPDSYAEAFYIIEELNGIFTWSVEGLQRLTAQGGFS